MPRELAHWSIAARIAAALPTGALGGYVAAHQRAFLLGAIAPDTGFYQITGRRRRAFRRAAQRAHGADGRDTLAFLPATATAAGWAFLAGVVTHVCVDSQFHPLVYYFCGTHKSPLAAIRHNAVVRHQRLETYFDYFFLHHQPPPYLYVRDLTRGTVGAGVLRAAQTLYLQPAAALRRAFRRHAQLQMLYYPSWFRAMLVLLNHIRPLPLDPVISLGYRFPGGRPLHFLATPIEYRHPVTGRTDRASLWDLQERAVVMAVDLLCRLQPRLVSLERGGAAAAGSATGASLPRGPSLETGLTGPHPPMQFFAIRDVAELARSAGLG